MQQTHPIYDRLRVFSGIQPTGTLHIGNYFGAIRNWIALQNDYHCIYSIVDYHAITAPFEPDRLHGRCHDLALDLLACGIDPKRSILFIQSAVPEHAELSWILSAITSFGDLSRMTQFKEKSQEKEFISAGLFTYPILQAADILLYRAQRVPVGEDQLQHLELSRRIARRFNSRFGDFFPEIEPLVGKGARIMSLANPSRKMSKSDGEAHYIGVMEDERSIRKKIRSAVTDIGPKPEQGMSEGVANLFQILELTGESDLYHELQAEFTAGTLLYSNLKEIVFQALVKILRPVQERRAVLAAEGQIEKILSAGAERARAIAKENIRVIRRMVGLEL
ncbi:tryptophan--tRNA ligase [Candidatus Bipolaricaulota bacterium]|nr:tryptophan--tRNA ligase [Candidatus Bipolaricaulota bacterium]